MSRVFDNRWSEAGLIVAITVLVTGAALFVLPILPNVQFWLNKRDGFALFRKSDQHIWLTWNMESGAGISPTSTLTRSAVIWLRHPDLLAEWRITTFQGTWMFDMTAFQGTPSTYTAYINPKNDDAEELIYMMNSIASAEPRDWRVITELAAQHYTFLGWVVRNEAEVAALREAVESAEELDRDADIETRVGVLPRIRFGVEREFAESPDDENELERIRAEIPVLFERVNPALGHPRDTMHVLYLDGHIEEIPFGERFPATPEFFQALFPEEDWN